MAAVADPGAAVVGTVPFAVNFDRFRAPIDPFLILLAALAITASSAERCGSVPE